MPPNPQQPLRLAPLVPATEWYRCLPLRLAQLVPVVSAGPAVLILLLEGLPCGAPRHHSLQPFLGLQSKVGILSPGIGHVPCSSCPAAPPTRTCTAFPKVGSSSRSCGRFVNKCGLGVEMCGAEVATAGRIAKQRGGCLNDFQSVMKLYKG